MRVDYVAIRGHRCFKGDWAELSALKPINLIIGRNNAGKSQFLEFMQALCSKPWPKRAGWEYRFAAALDEQSLRKVFQENTSEGELRGRHWHDHGVQFVGKRVKWNADPDLHPSGVEFEFDLTSKFGERSTRAREQHLHAVLAEPSYALQGSTFRSLLAERDVQPEGANTNLDLQPSGTGATNIIRRYLTSSNPAYPSELIQHDLLAGLNAIFGSDGHFTNIHVKEHDEPGQGVQGYWEVYLAQQKKGLVPLSKSGSGLKTVILVLLNLLVVPRFAKSSSRFVFAFEELENNIHPSLLRRLLRFIEAYAEREKATFFLTTHSSVALDVLGASEAAQILHVTHDGESARARAITAHFDQLSVVSELGSKPSDLLQANGIIWLEGPSDRIYLNRWLELLSDGQLREGRDYQCAFYAGSLLARTQFQEPSKSDEELVNLLRLNSNVIVVCDSDRTASTGTGSELKERVVRIGEQIATVPHAFLWVTAAKEIENYLSGSVLQKVFGGNAFPDPGQFEQFFPSDAAGAPKSFVERVLQRKSVDKVDLALRAAPLVELTEIATRFDLNDALGSIVERIRKWNA